MKATKMAKRGKTRYTQKQFEKDAKIIASWAKELRVKSVYGKPRGGLTLAVRISYLLDIPLVLDEKKITRNTLVVDDLVDGGKTMRRLFARLKKRELKPPMASTYFKKGAAFTPDFYLREKKKRWIKFPWEGKLRKTK